MIMIIYVCAFLRKTRHVSNHMCTAAEPLPRD